MKRKHGDVLGEGTFGKVTYHEDGTARKEMKNYADKDGVDSMMLREIFALKYLKHANVVKLLRLEKNEEGIPSVLHMEYCDFDLKAFMRQNHPVGIASSELRKKLSTDIARGIEFIHDSGFLHRDLKPQNILVATNPLNIVAKIGDLGLIKKQIRENFTPSVVTIWYRAPEILLCGEQNKDYENFAIDVWSFGLIAWEMIVNNAVCKGDSEIGQLFEIFNLLGTPSETTWHGFKNLKNWTPTFPQFKTKFNEKFPSNASTQERELIESCLRFIPHTRPSMSGILTKLENGGEEIILE